MADVLIGDLLELPDRIHKGDFVLNLSEGVTRPEATLSEYVVTPQLAECFDDALNFIRSSLDEKKSKAAYLHGSFGAGKSHFMAVLHLLLQHHPAIRQRAELANLCDRHQWAEPNRFLLVPYHLIGARNLESAILGGYVDYVRKVHPKSPLPGVFVADDIFTNAEQLRKDLGDAKFFAKLNQSNGPDDEWGALENGWDEATFDFAVQAGPGDEARSRLVGNLIQYVFPSYLKVASSAKEEVFVPLDQGLSILSRHAKLLGYDALILFLDELILWLASHAADLPFLHREGQKLAKLVESQSSDRPVPVISFVARQRDLRELVGDAVTGSERVSFSDALKHWEGRFHTITLEDRNLPAIAEKRVIRPKSNAARDQIDRTFQQVLTKFRQEVRDILLTQDADERMFRQTYPFSPAFVQTLVAVSSALQRERTALRIMLQILVDQKDRLKLGDLVPVGELWDQVAHGEDAFSDALRVHFANARKLYHAKLRPLLVEENQIDPEQEGLPTDATTTARLASFRTDDRLMKTLLLAAIVPEVQSLKGLTPTRLAALNWGSIKAPVPGQEGRTVLNKLRKWAARVGEIRISDESGNPTVTLQVAGVDTDAIIRNADLFDKTGNRQRKIREMVAESLKIDDPDKMFLVYPFVWRATKRDCGVEFANARDITDGSLKPNGDDWKLVIDLPFDPEGHDRVADLDRIRRFRETQKDARTIIWLPAFFSSKTMNDLGKLVIIDHLLRGDVLDQYSRGLTIQDRVTARSILESQRSALNAGIRMAIEIAYGIREFQPGVLDATHDSAEERFYSLTSTFTPQPPVGATLADAMEHILGQALESQFPGHPKFDLGKKTDIKLSQLRTVLETIEAAVRDEDGRTLVEKVSRTLIKQIVTPLDLGTMGETHFVLGSTWKTRFEKQLASGNISTPKVQQLREWIDTPALRGLPEPIENLVILSFALQTDRAFWRHHRAEKYDLEKIPGEAELRSQPMPTTEEWREAKSRASSMFGANVSDVLTAANVTELVRIIRGTIEPLKEAPNRLPERLLTMAGYIGIDEATTRKMPRLLTAFAVRDLVKGLDFSEPTACIQTLSRTRIETNALAMGKSLKVSESQVDKLQAMTWDLFTALSGIQGENQKMATDILTGLREVFAADEKSPALIDALDQARAHAVRLLTVQTSKPTMVVSPPPVPTGWKVVTSGEQSQLDVEKLRKLIGDLESQLKGKQKRISIRWQIEEENR